MNIFSICSRNFIGYATTLWSSLARLYPDVNFHLVLCDDVGDFDVASLPYPVIEMSELGIPALDEMRRCYNITELNTALKPFAFLYLFKKYPAEAVVYLDPDILAVSEFEELEGLLDGGADCVLTPHITGPSEFSEMNDRQFLIYGVYNLGFCALRDTPLTRRVVAWWGRRLERECIIDLANGIFVDQKWADLLPSFIPNTQILRHPGYNIAYWNLAQRRLSMVDSRWLVNGEPVRFVHFSGNKIEDEAIFSRHGGQFTPQNSPVLRVLLKQYREQMFRNGHSSYSGIDYAFDWNGSSLTNEHTPRALSLDRLGSAKSPHLPVLRSRSMGEFWASRRHNHRNVERRVAVELNAIPEREPIFSLSGFCSICGRRNQFRVGPMYSSRHTVDGRTIPNWREHLDCEMCGFNNRIRGAHLVLEQEFSPSKEDAVYITEQVTPLFSWLQKKWPNIVGSEYLSGNISSGMTREGIRHEDVQSLSFRNQVFDLILSFDVLEHVPDRQKAFVELFRCLKPGGRLFFTVPFSYSHAEEVVRCQMRDDGSIQHYLEPEYHGNPVNAEEGALCFRYFGWSVLEHLGDAGFVDAEVISYWSKELLNFGDPQFVITACRPKTCVESVHIDVERAAATV